MDGEWRPKDWVVSLTTFGRCSPGRTHTQRRFQGEQRILPMRRSATWPVQEAEFADFADGS